MTSIEPKTEQYDTGRTSMEKDLHFLRGRYAQPGVHVQHPTRPATSLAIGAEAIEVYSQPRSAEIRM